MNTEFALTAEVRWFEKGKLPTPLWEYWLDASQFAVKESRVDDYLIFPNSDHVGVKIREGKLEIKSLVETGKNIDIAGLKATCETWEKLSIEEDLNQDKLLKKPYRCAVDKSRVTITFNQRDDQWQPIDTSEWVDHGCQVEIVEVRVGNDIFWSFSLEAFAEHQSPSKVLGDYAIHLDQDAKMKNLIERYFKKPITASYPTFLRDNRS